MRRSNTVPILVIAIVVIVGVLGLRFRPALPSAERPAASAAPPSTRGPTYPPANVDGRIETVTSGRIVELCGYGPIEITAEQVFPPHLTAAADRALVQANAALAASGTARQRAAARYVQGTREALVADALTARDASAYALAFYACLRVRSEPDSAGSCRLVNAAQWAQLEPDNAMAWVHAAWEAHARGDAAGRAESLRRAAQATESRLHMDAIFEPLRHSALRNLDAPTRSIVQTTLVGIHAAIPIPGPLVLNEECAGKPALDEPRREVCSALGRTLAERGGSLFELGLGLRLGQRAGWPDTELRTLRERLDAAQQVLSQAPPPWSCDFQRLAEQYTAGALDGGELKLASRLVQSSERPPAELAQAWRARSVPQSPVPR